MTKINVGTELLFWMRANDEYRPSRLVEMLQEWEGRGYARRTAENGRIVWRGTSRLKSELNDLELDAGADFNE